MGKGAVGGDPGKGAGKPGTPGKRGPGLKGKGQYPSGKQTNKPAGRGSAPGKKPPLTGRAKPGIS